LIEKCIIFGLIKSFAEVAICKFWILGNLGPGFVKIHRFLNKNSQSKGAKSKMKLAS
jgi:hypothetical protein